MGNRVLQTKRFKMRARRIKLRGQYTKDQIAKDRSLDKPGSLSKQLINGGLRVPGKPVWSQAIHQAKIEFFNRGGIDLIEEIPRTLGIHASREMAEKLIHVLQEKDMRWMHNLILKTKTLRVYCYFDSRMTEVFLVRVDYVKQTIQRSVCNYPSVDRANQSAVMGKVVWRRPTHPDSTG